MRKKAVYILILLLACTAGYGQDGYDRDPRLQGLYKFTKNYFRSDPFTGEFSGFLKHLINDPAMRDKFTQKRTDTSFYAFHGIYTSYNPFSFIPKEVAILLEETPIVYDDSLHISDTIFTYQLLVYADDDVKGREAIKKEFEKLHRQNRNKFFDSNYNEITEGNEVTAAVHSYFVATHWLAPVSIAWGRVEEKKELVLNITLRVKMSANKAILPAPLYSTPGNE